MKGEKMNQYIIGTLATIIVTISMVVFALLCTAEIGVTTVFAVIGCSLSIVTLVLIYGEFDKVTS